MRTLYLHIGLGKTGSSALQSWLSLNAELLCKQGIDYADTVPEVKYGESLSGNGSPLYRACVAQAFDEVESLLTSTYFCRPDNSVAIVSCELLQGIKPTTIAELKAIFDRLGIEVKVIAYVRSVYEALYSTYSQFVKRGSCTHSFGEDAADTSFNASVDYLKRYREVFHDKLIVLNYDAAKKDIYASFAAVTGIDPKGLKRLKIKVNRSLSFQEVETLRRVNALHRGAFSTQISNFIIANSPSINTPVFYDEALVRQVRENSAEGVEWINQQFFLDPPLVTDFFTGNPSVRAEASAFRDYQPVLQWALEYAPTTKQMADFVVFLKEFSALMVEFSADDALALLRRANAVQRDIVVEEAEEAEDAGEHDPVPFGSRYLMSYFHDSDAPGISAEGSTFASDFNAWLGLIEGHALGNTLCPLEDTRLIGAPGQSAPPRQPPVSGYSVIVADSIEEVVSLAQQCPLLDIGGIVEVSQIVQLLQPGEAQPSDRDDE